MSIYTVKLIDRKKIAENTMAFIFEKPEGFDFKAGQFGDITLIDPPETDEEGNTRGFSIASPPYAEYLMVASRMRNTAFKRVLKELPLGTTVKWDAPYGSFLLHNKATTPAVYLTGGIGITPVHSIVLQATKAKLPHQIFIFYSNNRPEDAAFLEELKALESENPNFKLIGTMTHMENSKQPWQGETGYINQDMLAKYIKNLSVPIYYVSGPPAMVAAMRKMLNASGVDDDNIRTEEFTGYESLAEEPIKRKGVIEEMVAAEELKQTVQQKTKKQGSSGPGDTTKNEFTSLWIATTPSTHYPALPKNIETDVVVAGGGIAGISTAIFLKQKGLKVVLIESDKIVEKTSGNTTAKLTALHGLKYKSLLDSFSQEGVKMYADANQAAISCVEKLVKQYNIDCDCLPTSAYTYAVAEEDRKLVEDEANAAKKVGLLAEYITDVPLPYKTYGAVKLNNQMQFHVRKYLLGLAKEIDGDGSYLFEKTKAIDVNKEKNNQYTIITDKGTIKTTFLIIATHYPFYDPEGFYSGMEKIRDYALGVLLDEPTPQGMYYSTGDDPYSIRYQPTQEGDIVVIGGGWEPEESAKDPERKFEGNLKRYSEKFKIKSVRYKWYTHDYVTKDGVPYIGRLTESLNNIYVITGFAGWGMSTGTAAGMILSDLIVTGKNQWSSFFDPFERKRFVK